MTETITLSSNALLNELVDQFPKVTPNWPRLIEAFKRTDKYRLNLHRPDSIAGMVGELFMQRYLKRWEGKSSRVIYSPIPNQARRKDFKFNISELGNCQIAQREPHGYQTYAEWDAVMLIDNLPTVFELKTSKPSQIPREVNGFLTPSTYRTRLLPFQEYFRTNTLGMVLIVPQGSFSEHSIAKHNFEQAGGKIGSLYTTSERYYQEVENAVKQFKLFTHR